MQPNRKIKAKDLKETDNEKEKQIQKQIQKNIQKNIQKQINQNSKSFMDKFKNKHSVISKQGLLKLFENNKFTSQQSKQTPILKKQQQPINVNAKLILKSKQKVKIDEIIKKRSQRKGSDVTIASIAKSVNLPQLKIKFPKIQKSISTTVQLREKTNSTPISKTQTEKIPRSINKSPTQEMKNKRPLEKYNFELDKFALDHLDFLDKFQERIRRRQITP